VRVKIGDSDEMMCARCGESAESEQDEVDGRKHPELGDG